MGDLVPIPPPGFEALSAEETSVEALPLTDWQEQLLAERLKDLDENPEPGIPWSEVRAGVLRKLD